MSITEIASFGDKKFIVVSGSYSEYDILAAQTNMYV